MYNFGKGKNPYSITIEVTIIELEL